MSLIFKKHDGNIVLLLLFCFLDAGTWPVYQNDCVYEWNNMMQSKPRPSLAIKMKICKILDIAPAFRKYEKRNGSNFVILKIEQIWQLQKVKMRQKFGPTGIIIEPPEFLTDSSEATLKYCTQSKSTQKINSIQTLQISQHRKLYILQCTKGSHMFSSTQTE